MAGEAAVPAGQVSCLLCRGFISVADGDRARFVDHMHSEHEVKHEPEVVLAVSVLTPREKLFLIKTAAARLEAIGRGRAPDLATSFLDKLEAAGRPQPIPRPPQQAPRPQQAAPPSRAGRGAVGPVPAAQPRAPRPQAPQPRVVAPPRQLAANTSISISKVDMSRPCNMCQVVMPNPAALVEHMNQNHFRGLQGLNIIQGGASPAPKPQQTAPAPRTPAPPPRPSAPAPRTPTLTPAQAKALSVAKSSSPRPPTPRAPAPQRAPQKTPVRGAAPGAPPGKAARLQGVSFSKPGGGGGLPVEGFGGQVGEGAATKESSIRKEVEGLQTLELLDNLVNFLNE